MDVSETGRFRLVIRLELDDEVLASRTPASAVRVGYELADQVTEFQRRFRLSYFPPLAYCIEQGCIEPDLVEAFESLHWLTAQLSRREVLRSLRGLLAEVRTFSVVNQARTMPRIRPREANAGTALAWHLRPNRLRMELSGRARKARMDAPWLQEQVESRLQGSFSALRVAVYSDQALVG